MPDLPAARRLRTENNVFQHLEVLKRNRTRRHQYQEFFVEGVRCIDRLLDNGWELESICWQDGELSDWGRKTVARSGARSYYQLTTPLMEKLSDKEETSEVLATARMRADDLQRIPWRQDLVLLILDRPSSPGNLGTVIRSADALGAHGVVVSGHSADLYDPRTIRASQGSIFAIPVVRASGPPAIADWLASSPIRPTVIGTDPERGTSIGAATLTAPVALIAGNERTGMSHAFRTLCDELVTIPLPGSADSLNLSAAVSIVLYEMLRDRLTRPV
jgi:23S rRNA (uridine2479-2'-O)-methyltransferase